MHSECPRARCQSQCQPSLWPRCWPWATAGQWGPAIAPIWGCSLSTVRAFSRTSPFQPARAYARNLPAGGSPVLSTTKQSSFKSARHITARQPTAAWSPKKASTRPAARGLFMSRTERLLSENHRHWHHSAATGPARYSCLVTFIANASCLCYS